mmetsp:Transcript_4554/g.11883  ORF Transcript_4554/g.11883 Transcript_4554/m.11883 type:complete len:253 (-) Transcript_4554:208-966(-)
MHEIWDFKPPSPCSSSSSDDDGEDKRGNNDTSRRLVARGKSARDNRHVSISDSSDSGNGSAKKHKANAPDEVEDEDFDVTAPKMSQVNWRSDSASSKTQKALIDNVAKMKKLKSEVLESGVDAIFDDIKHNVDREEAANRELLARKRQEERKADDELLPNLATSTSEAPKEASAQQDRIVICICMPDEKKHEFRIASSDNMSKVFEKMASIVGNDQFVLDFDGEHLSTESVPESLDIEDGDRIDLYIKKNRS